MIEYSFSKARDLRYRFALSYYFGILLGTDELYYFKPQLDMPCLAFGAFPDPVEDYRNLLEDSWKEKMHCFICIREIRQTVQTATL